MPFITRGNKIRKHKCSFPLNFFKLRFEQGAIWECPECLFTYQARWESNEDAGWWVWDKVEFTGDGKTYEWRRVNEDNKN